MKNKYFSNMQKEGIKYLKSGRYTESPLFTTGESLAFKYWSIANHYNSTEIVIDKIPEQCIANELIETFRKAGIGSFVIVGEAIFQQKILTSAGCLIMGECRVFRQETHLYTGRLEILKGIKVIVNDNR